MRGAILALAALTMTGGTTMAAAFTIPGGPLDPAYDKADVYLETPPAAPVPPGRACAVAARYVELINAGRYLEAAALYHDDATFAEPMRPNLKGRKQIDDFYTRYIGGMKPHIIPVSYTGDDHQCSVALANRVELDGKTRYMLASVDLFTLREDGKVDSMVAFARPRD
jgi:hypothetical protein